MLQDSQFLLQRESSHIITHKVEDTDTLKEQETPLSLPYKKIKLDSSDESTQHCIPVLPPITLESQKFLQNYQNANSPVTCQTPLNLENPLNYTPRQQYLPNLVQPVGNFGGYGPLQGQKSSKEQNLLQSQNLYQQSQFNLLQHQSQSQFINQLQYPIQYQNQPLDTGLLYQGPLSNYGSVNTTIQQNPQNLSQQYQLLNNNQLNQDQFLSQKQIQCNNQLLLRVQQQPLYSQYQQTSLASENQQNYNQMTLNMSLTKEQQLQQQLKQEDLLIQELQNHQQKLKTMSKKSQRQQGQEQTLINQSFAKIEQQNSDIEQQQLREKQQNTQGSQLINQTSAINKNRDINKKQQKSVKKPQILCNKCDFKTFDIQVFSIHKLNIHKQSLSAHFKEMLENVKEGEDPYSLNNMSLFLKKEMGENHQCKVCELQCSNNQNLKEHIRLHHFNNPRKLFKCQYEGCSFEGHFSQSFKNHLRTKHKLDIETRVYKCKNVGDLKL